VGVEQGSRTLHCWKIPRAAGLGMGEGEKRRGSRQKRVEKATQLHRGKGGERGGRTQERAQTSLFAQKETREEMELTQEQSKNLKKWERGGGGKCGGGREVFGLRNAEKNINTNTKNKASRRRNQRKRGGGKKREDGGRGGSLRPRGARGRQRKKNRGKDDGEDRQKTMRHRYECKRTAGA